MSQKVRRENRVRKIREKQIEKAKIQNRVRRWTMKIEGIERESGM